MKADIASQIWTDDEQEYLLSKALMTPFQLLPADFIKTIELFNKKVDAVYPHRRVIVDILTPVMIEAHSKFKIADKETVINSLKLQLQQAGIDVNLATKKSTYYNDYDNYTLVAEALRDFMMIMKRDEIDANHFAAEVLAKLIALK